MTRSIPTGVARVSEHDDTVRDAAGQPIDRFHNQEPAVPEDMAGALARLRGSLEGLEARLDQINSGLGGQIDGAGLMTRRLAHDVAEMGGVLSRRLRTLETQPTLSPPTVTPRQSKPPAEPPRAAWVWSLGLAVLLGLAIAGIRRLDHLPQPPMPVIRAPVVQAPASPTPMAPASVAQVPPSQANPPEVALRKDHPRRPFKSRPARPRSEPPSTSEAFHSYGPSVSPPE